MERLGHPATWPTRCFIGSGCGAHVFGHTNGYGDFVLFDELGWPWLVHDCYSRRFELSKAASNRTVVDMRASREVLLPDFEYPWQEVTELKPTDVKRGTVLNLIGTVTDLKKGVRAADRFDQPADRREFLKRMKGRDSAVEVVDGRTGAQVTAWIDVRDLPVKIKDTIAIQVEVLNIYIDLKRHPTFVVTQARIYRGRKGDN